MKAIVNPDLCIGCEACVDLCPEVFEMDGDKAVTKTEDVSEAQMDYCQEAADLCPVDAIMIEP